VYIKLTPLSYSESNNLTYSNIGTEEINLNSYSCFNCTFCWWNVNSYTLQRALLFDWVEWTTLQILNGNSLVYLFYLNSVTLNSCVKNLVSRNEYVNTNHGNGGGYVKNETYLGIRLLVEVIYLRIKHVYLLLLYMVYRT
jgi:hypothetical protein